MKFICGMAVSAINYRLLLLVLLISLLIHGACKKNNNDGNSNSYRVTEYEGYINNVLNWQYQIQYDGERMISLNAEKLVDPLQQYTIEYEYPDEDSIVSITTYKIGDTSYPYFKEIFRIENNHVTKYTMYGYSGGTWEPSLIYDYLYENDLLIQETESYDSSGNWMLDQRINYEYEGDLFARAVMYAYHDDWCVFGKEEVNYSNGKINEVIFYDSLGGSFVEDSKGLYHYQGDLVTRIDIYVFASGLWTPIDSYYAFTYDSNGNLESSTFHDNSVTYTDKYTYEEGKGNYRQIFYNSSVSLLPLPTKAKYQAPRFKFPAPCLKLSLARFE